MNQIKCKNKCICSHFESVENDNAKEEDIPRNKLVYVWGKSWYNNDDKSCAWTLNTLINFFNYTYSFKTIYLYHLLFQLSQTWCILLRLTALASCFTSIVLWIYVFMSSILWFDINVSIYSISLFSFLYFYEVLRRIICRICMRYQKYIKLEQIEAIQPQTKHITAFAKLVFKILFLLPSLLCSFQ